MAAGGSKKPIAVYGAIVANAIIAVAKFTAAFFTGSSAMVSEGIHSVVDTGNQALLLLGINLSKRPADDVHPFGHGKELYFWGMVVAMILFGVGGGLSIYEGISHLQHPTELRDPTWNYAVLGIGIVVEGVAWGIALREVIHTKLEEEDLWMAIRTSKDPSLYTVLAEDTAAILGLMVAAGGIFLAHRFNNPAMDGYASIVIGLILAVVAIFLAYETRRLLLGESADVETVRNIRRLVESDSAVERAEQPMTMHFGPKEILLNLGVQFRSGLSAAEVASAVDRLEKQIRKNHSDISRIFIETDSIKGKELHERSDSK